MNEHDLPEDDPDLRAARQLGFRLDGTADTSENDPLLDILDRVRARNRVADDTLLPDADQSAMMWEAVVTHVAATPHAGPRPAVRHQRLRSTFTRISIAASFAAVLILSWLVLRQNNDPVLLAEATDRLLAHTTEEGSVITLRPHSRLYLETAHETEQHYRLEGEAYFDVVRNESRVFRVTAGDATVTVLGTRFSVTSRGVGVDVFLRSGSITLQHNLSQQTVVLKPGDLGRVNSLGAEVSSEAGAEDEALDWIDNELRFSRQPISQVVEELAFHFGIAIDFPSDRLSETISGTIVLDTLQRALDQLGIVTGSQGAPDGDGRFRFERSP